MGEARPEVSGSHITDPGKEARSASGIPVVPAFDGFRAFAILGVVMLHLITFSGLVEIGDQGLASRLTWGFFGRSVEILFVVSGFVVFLPTVARDGRFGSVGSYAIRRGARLLPAYWLILAISLLLLATVDLEAASLPFVSGVQLPNLLSILSNFAGAENGVAFFFDDVSIGFGVNPPLWTLSIELGFYLVLPLVASRYFRKPWIGLLIAAAVTLGWSLIFEHLIAVSDFIGLDLSFTEAVRMLASSSLQLPAWAFSFALGMTGAWAYVRLTDLTPDSVGRRKVLIILGASAFATIGLAYLNGGYFDQTRESIWLSMAFSASLALAMVSLSLAPRSLQTVFAATPVRRLGDISYGVYLSHLLLMIYLGDHFLSLSRDGTFGNLVVWIAVVLPTSILYGYLSARFLEQPIRRRARRFGRRNAG